MSFDKSKSASVGFSLHSGRVCNYLYFPRRKYIKQEVFRIKIGTIVAIVSIHTSYCKIYYINIPTLKITIKK